MMWHLPTPPQGYRYAPRTFQEKTIQHNPQDGTYSEPWTTGPHGRYCTVGLFPIGAPNAQVEHLAYIPVLFLDCDLCDYLMYTSQPGSDQWDKVATKQAKLQIKYMLQHAPQEQVKQLVRTFAAYANAQLKALTGTEATYTLDSGYGVHMYLWLPPEQWADLDTCRAAQIGIVQALNNSAGFELADKNVKDAGTRVLRPPGTYNGKGAHPRLVEAVSYSLQTFDCRSLPTPVVQPRKRSTATPAPSQPIPAGAPIHIPAAQTTGGTSVVDRVWDTSATSQARQLTVLCQEEPFFVWAYANAGAVNEASWRAIANTLAAIAGESGRPHFHAMSRADESRYQDTICDKWYDYALKFMANGGRPEMYTTLQNDGEWPGNIPSCGSTSPYAFAVHRAQLPDTSNIPEALVLDGKSRPTKAYTNIRRILRSEEMYGTRLKLNLMSGGPEHDGVPVEEPFYGSVQETLQIRYDVGFSLAYAQQAVNEIAHENAHHPVEDYLKSLKWDSKDRLPALLKAMHVQDTALHREYLQCFLVSAVRRGLCEDVNGKSQTTIGVKVDTTLILTGPQGCFKSTFFKALVGAKWCNDSPMQPGTKEAMQLVSQKWVAEWSEFEKAYSRHASETKAFLSSQVDIYRKPYARNPSAHARRSVIVGTTNQDQFLHDDTGSRRFWIMHIEGPIDIAKVVSIRQQLWAQAVHLHRQGVQHWLTETSDDQRAVANETYQTEGKWDDVITKFLTTSTGLAPHTTIDIILERAVQKDVSQCTLSDRMSVGKALKDRGYLKKRLRSQGSNTYVYVQPGTDPRHAVKLTLVPDIDAPVPQTVQ